MSDGTPMAGRARRVVIAGASGFVGRALVRRLVRRGDVVVHALTRGASARPCTEADWERTSESRGDRDGREVRDVRHAERLDSLRCDLFSLVQAEDALAGADIAVYLVHSMQPHSRLVQASFSDIDLLLADNFARAAVKAGMKRIVYLGGMMPGSGARPSKHLVSREEVERALAGHGTPVRVLRAGLVIGPGGSSTEMVVRLVNRLPIMLCPSWTRNVSYPVALRDAVASLEALVLDDSRCPFGEAEVPGRPLVFDCAGPTPSTYFDLIGETARLLGHRRLLVPFPFVPPKVSALWVSLVSRFDLALVSPLVDSLRFELRPSSRVVLPSPPLAPATQWRDALADVIGRVHGSPVEEREQTPFHGTFASDTTVPASVHPAATSAPAVPPALGTPDARNRVVSVQRMPCPPGWDASDVAQDYARWLPLFFRPLLRVRFDGRRVEFLLLLPRVPLLELELAPERSDTRRQLFFIRGGELARVREGARGRLEFRTVGEEPRKELLAAVIDFEPSLPWVVYRITQALAHAFVMACYRVRLIALARRGAKPAGFEPAERRS